MPNAKILAEKQAVVASMVEKLKNASAGVLVDYKGITVEHDTKLRAELRKNNVEYSVVKNTLTRFAAKEVGFEALDPVLNGTTALAISMDDSIAPARVISEFIKKNPKVPFEIKAGFVDGQVDAYRRSSFGAVFQLAILTGIRMVACEILKRVLHSAGFV